MPERVPRLAPRRIELPVSHGRLEALLQEPESPIAAAVICHPHPLMGGTMDNNVVYRLGRGLYDAGLATLRFNFRGVGASTGQHAGGAGEEEDVSSAVDFLRERLPGLPTWIAGFSFGARVGLSVAARDDRVARLLGVGLALSIFDFTFLAASTKPKAFIQGELDEFGSGEQVKALVSGMAEPKHLVVVPGASHLFPGKLPQLELAIAEAIESLRGAQSCG